MVLHWVSSLGSGIVGDHNKQSANGWTAARLHLASLNASQALELRKSVRRSLRPYCQSFTNKPVVNAAELMFIRCARPSRQGSLPGARLTSLVEIRLPEFWTSPSDSSEP